MDRVGEVPLYLCGENLLAPEYEYISHVVQSLVNNTSCHIRRPVSLGTMRLTAIATVSLILYTKAHKIKKKIVLCVSNPFSASLLRAELEKILAKAKQDTKVSGSVFIMAEQSENSAQINLNASFVACNELRGKCVSKCNNSHENVEYPELFSYGDIRELASQLNACVYCLAQDALERCDCAVVSSEQLVSPFSFNYFSCIFNKTTSIFGDFTPEIDYFIHKGCLMKIDRALLEGSSNSLKRLENQINEETQEQAAEFKKKATVSKHETILDGCGPTVPYFYCSGVYKMLPGSMRQERHVFSILRRCIEYLKVKLKTADQDPTAGTNVLKHMDDLVCTDSGALPFLAQRFSMLLLEHRYDFLEYRELAYISNFISLLSIMPSSTVLVHENEAGKSTMKLVCFDYKRIIDNIASKVGSFVVSGEYCENARHSDIQANLAVETLYIRDFYTVISKGNDQTLLKTDHNPLNENSKASVEDRAVLRNYGMLLSSLSCAIPNNIVCIFPSRSAINELIAAWDEMGMLSDIQEKKLIFVEPEDDNEVKTIVNYFINAHNAGRTAVLLSVAKGPIAKYAAVYAEACNAVLFFGLPYDFSPTGCNLVREKYYYNRVEVNEGFYTDDAIQTILNIIDVYSQHSRTKKIFSLIDSRFSERHTVENMPSYIQKCLLSNGRHQTTENALESIKHFLKNS
ncbi:DNA excision repair protein ERCC-2 [Enteropsectra breve]|nr:DNA excision repair protein ERCC-2 [Enteropsectra breve]